MRRVLLALLLLSCGGSRAAPTSVPSATSATDAVDAAPVASGAAPAPSLQPPGLPTSCDRPSANICTPPPAFVDKLCNGAFLEAALALFAKDMPWTRGYLRGSVDAWYASGGASARSKLDFDEEVLIIRVRASATSGIVVGGGGTSYDVLRWDGMCFTLDAGEITTRRPPKPKRASIPFHLLGARLRDALLADEHVNQAHAKRAKECKGVTRGDVSLACVKADAALSAAIAEYVRAGSALPPPEKLP